MFILVQQPLQRLKNPLKLLTDMNGMHYNELNQTKMTRENNTDYNMEVYSI